MTRLADLSSKRNGHMSHSNRDADSFSIRFAELFPISALIILVGSQTYALVSPLMRYGFMLMGLAMAASYVLLHFRLLQGRITYILGWLAFMGISEGLNLLNAAFPFDLRSGAFRFICYLFILCGVVMGLRQSNAGSYNLNWLCRLPIVFAWIVVAGAVFVYWGNVSATLAFTASSRFGGDDLHPVGIAFGIGTCMAVALAFLMYDRSPMFRLTNLIMLATLARGLLLTGSRGALLSFISVAIILGLCKNRYLGGRHRAWFMIAAVFMCVGLFASLRLSGFAQEQAQLYLYRMGSLGAGNDGAANARLVTWQLYAEQFSSWALLGYRSYAGDYPHNFFYELWLRFGLLGLAASLFTAWVVTRAVFLMWRQQLPPLFHVAIGILLFGFVNAQTNLALEFNRTFWLGVGFAVVIVINPPPTKSNLRLGSGFGRGSITSDRSLPKSRIDK
jgi:hypothetical protein